MRLYRSATLDSISVDLRPSRGNCFASPWSRHLLLYVTREEEVQSVVIRDASKLRAKVEAAGREATIRSMVAHELAAPSVNSGVAGWAKTKVEKAMAMLERETAGDEPEEFDVDGTVNEYRSVMAQLDNETTRLGNVKLLAKAKLLRQAWKEWQDSLHVMAFGEIA